MTARLAARIALAVGRSVLGGRRRSRPQPATDATGDAAGSRS
jgi:hypothetical protein